jgi:CDP-paratose 2-epimerase
MNYKTILVTGGAGFVGSNLAVAFKEKYPKTRVFALDNLKRRGSEMNIARLKENNVFFVHGDIRNPEDLVLGTKIDLLLECSAEPSVMAGLDNNPLYIINTNLTGTINCLELARRNKADVIFLSTSRVYPYGAINDIKAKEEKKRFTWKGSPGIGENFTTCGPKTFYGATKLASELLLREYIENYGIKGVINRCGVIAGPWQFGKCDQGVFTFWMLSHYFKRPLKYIGFGGKGKQVRDLLHVDDLFLLIERQIKILSKINGEVFNIGGGKEVSLSLLELTQLCRKLTGNRLDIGSLLENRPGDVRIYLTDYAKARKRLGWRPQRSAERILRDIYRWIRENESAVKQALL